MNRPTVGVFIPAYNEEKNIRNILEDVLNQRDDFSFISEIKIISDGSTDKTNSIIKEIRITNEKIKLIASKERKGIVHRINQAFSENTYDILIRVDADVRMPDKNTFNKLLSDIEENTGLICGNVQVHSPRNYIQKIGYFGKDLWNNIRDSLGLNSMAYRCHGSLYAVLKKYADTVNMPDVASGDDTFLFFDATQKGFEVLYKRDAVVYQQLPKTLEDYIKQHVKYDADNISKYFPKDLIKKHNTIKLNNIVWHILKKIIKYPITGIPYIIIRSYILLFKKNFYKSTPKWNPSESTKSHL